MKRFSQIIISIIVVLSLFSASGVMEVQAANPAPVQLFYVTLPEDDGLDIIQAINTSYSPGDSWYSYSPIYTYFSIAIGVDGTYVYYDQWEDGYASDIANPTTGEIYSETNLDGVQIWGNGLAADGCAPNISGVAFTCTDGNDELSAGDVIIPYNAVPVPLVGDPQNYVLDTFATQSYSANYGNTNWNGDWVETGDGTTSPTSGDIYINNGELYFSSGTDASDSIDRGVDLSIGGDCATLSFDLTVDTDNDYNDYLDVQASADGTSYTTVSTYTGDSSNGIKTIDISSYATNSTRIRLLSRNSLGTSEDWGIDDVRVDWNCEPPILFDARDKVGASSSIAMARAIWATGSDTLLAFAHEMYATAEWGTYYETPVGTDTPSDSAMFEYSALSIMASQNNTTVQIDTNADGDFVDVGDITVTLQEGGTYLYEGVIQGTAVQSSDKPVQVLLVTGDIGSTYASRDMNLIPKSAWGSSYWSPVGTVYGANNTRLFLYNPGPSTIYITCERYGVADVTLGPVDPRDTVTTDLTDGQGAHCYASTSSGVATSDPISVLGTIDTGDTAYDWSFTVYPDTFLTTDGLVGLGLGQDPNQPNTENGNPIWVTAACDAGTWVYVDWNNDGVADPVDTNGDGTAETNSANGIFVNYLQSVRLFRPDPVTVYAQTGARVWSRTAQNMGDYDNLAGVPGCKLALAWGQDPANATAGAPGFDVGTSIPPLRLTEGSKSITYAPDGDTAPLTVLNPGDTIYYNIEIYNAGSVEVGNVYVLDNVPADTTYVADTSEWSTDESTWNDIPDDTVGTTIFPLDEGGVLLGDLSAGASFYVRFQVTLLDGIYEDITNCFTAITDAGTFRRCVTQPVATRDWGDLPNSYDTTANENGPRHSYDGLVMGTYWDYETQGVPSVDADGDDLANQDDEDGVTFTQEPEYWELGTGGADVTVSGGPGCLNAWMDFAKDSGAIGADGNFTIGETDVYDAYDDGGSGISEHIIQNALVNNGVNQFTFSVPPGLSYSYFYFRFRLSPADGEGTCTVPIKPSGPVTGGEVEDYRYLPVPTAIRDVTNYNTRLVDGGILISWETVNEYDIRAFRLWRESPGESLLLLDIPASHQFDPIGDMYEYLDGDYLPGVTYTYKLEVVSRGDTSQLSSTIRITRLYMPLLIK